MTRSSPVLPLIGSGTTKFQPVFVNDMTAGLFELLKRSDTAGKTYNFGGPQVYSFRALLELLLTALNRSRVLIPTSAGPILIVKIAARGAWSPMGPFEPSRVKRHRVAMIAKRTDLSAAPPRIKGVVTPFDLSDRTHAGPFSRIPANRQGAQRHQHRREQLQTDTYRKHFPQAAGEVTHRTKNARDQGVGDPTDRGL
jgi:hypothetical protein